MRTRSKTPTQKPPKPGQRHKQSNPLPAVELPKVGRPSPYRPEFAEVARRSYLLGYDDEETAALLGVNRKTLQRWIDEHEEFRLARAEGKQSFDTDIEVALSNRAKGYSHEAVKIMLGPGGQVIRETYTQHYPPDTQAAQLWLYNRKPDRWRDRRVVENQGEVGIKITVTGGLPDD